MDEQAEDRIKALADQLAAVSLNQCRHTAGDTVLLARAGAAALSQVLASKQAVERELEACYQVAIRTRLQSNTAEAALSTALQRVGELERALEPFARATVLTDVATPDSLHSKASYIDGPTRQDFDAARALLSTKKEPAPESLGEGLEGIPGQPCTDGALPFLKEPQHSDGWRALASVPRDGSRFWGKVDDDAIAMFWMDEFDGFVSGYRRMVMAPGYTVDGAAFKNHSPDYHSPTAWMPIPFSPDLSGPQRSEAALSATDEPIPTPSDTGKGEP